MTPYEKSLKIIESEHEIVDILFKYIDRMYDPCTSDPLEKSASEFICKVKPAISKHLELLWGYCKQ